MRGVRHVKSPAVIVAVWIVAAVGFALAIATAMGVL